VDWTPFLSYELVLMTDLPVSVSEANKVERYISQYSRLAPNI
jgi:hypothetical protein